jgi:hypothetical protein
MYSKGRGSRDFLSSLDLQQPMQSVYITIKVVSWNPVHVLVPRNSLTTWYCLSIVLFFFCSGL